MFSAVAGTIIEALTLRWMLRSTRQIC
jgi:hypothetical protein